MTRYYPKGIKKGGSDGGMTFREIATAMNLSEGRIRQIHKEAMSKIKKRVEDLNHSTGGIK